MVIPKEEADIAGVDAYDILLLYPTQFLVGRFKS